MSETKTYELSRVQDITWDQYKNNTPWLGISFICENILNEALINTIWERLTYQHQIFKTKFETWNGSERPFQTITEHACVHIAEVKNITKPEALSSYLKNTKDQVVSKSGNWVILYQHDKDQTRVTLSASQLSTDKTSLMQLASAFMNATEEAGNETLPYVQFSEWLKNSHDDQNNQVQRFWEERAFKINPVAIAEDIIEGGIGTFKKSMPLVSSQDVNMEALCFAMATTVLLKHSGKETLYVNWIYNGRFFEELNNIQGPFSVRCPLRVTDAHLNTINKAISEIDEELEAQQSMLTSAFPQIDAISSKITLEYLNEKEVIPSKWKFVETNISDKLKFEFIKKNNALGLTINYQLNKYDSKYIESLSEQIIHGISTYLSSGNKTYALISEDEFSRIERVSSGVSVPIDPNMLFDRLSGLKPDMPAIKTKDSVISYEALLASVNNLSINFKNRGIVKGAKVGLYTGATSNYIISLLSLWKLGAVAVPISKTAPVNRLISCLKQSKASHVISEVELSLEIENTEIIDLEDVLKPVESDLAIDDAVVQSKDDLAYILFTSGSTGEPKGCMLTHGNLSNYLTWASDYYIDERVQNASFPFFTSIGFDFTFTSILLPLINGGCVWVQNLEETIDEQLIRIAANDELSLVKLTPSHIRILKSLELKEFKPTKVIVGGEALDSYLIAYMEQLNPDIQLFNEYGPTEATVGCVVAPVTTDHEKVPIGSPIYNTYIDILDKTGEIVSDYTIGELIISGASLASGYINNNKNTAFKEVDTTIKKRQYHTGDLGYRDHIGELYFLGRKDDQVKIRGNRIEPSEIKIIAESYDDVQQVAVDIEVAKEKISLFITALNKIDEEKMQVWLKNYLMPYALPNRIVQINNMPLNENGKVDITALRKQADNELSDEVAEEITNLKSFKDLTGLWKEILRLDSVQPNDHFIRLGGDSIKAIQLVNKLKGLGYDINIREILEQPKLIDLSLYLEQKKPTEALSVFVPDAGHIALSPNQIKFLNGANGIVNGYCQTICFEMTESLDKESLEKAIRYLLKKHPMLHARFKKVDNEYTQYLDENHEDSLSLNWMTAHEFLEERNNVPIYELIDIEKGPLSLVYVVSNSGKSSIHIYTHHLVVDAISWRIIVEDINTAYHTYLKNGAAILEDKHHSYHNARVNYIKEHYKEDDLFWNKELMSLPENPSWIKGPFFFKNVKQKEFYVNSVIADELKGIANNRFDTQPIELLLTGIARTFKKLNKEEFVCLMENHGRQSIQGAPDVEGTVGWFTSVYPLRVPVSGTNNIEDDIRNVKSMYRSVPDNGIYFSYQHQESTVELPVIQVNYLGVYEESGDANYKMISDAFGVQTIHPELDIKVGFNLSIVFGQDGLHVVLSYDGVKIDESWVLNFSTSLKEELIMIASLCTNQVELAGQLDYRELDNSDLDDILGDL